MTTNLNPDAIQELIAQGESETVEFKTVVRNPSVLSQNLSAFANTNGGTLLVGIQEPDIVVGADEKQVQHVLDRSRKQLSSPIDVDVQTVTVDQKPVVALAVHPSKSIVFCNGQALGRVGATNQALTAAQLSAKLTPTPTAVDINKLADAIAKQTRTVQKLRDDLREANSLKSKLKDWLIGGTIGAVIGFLLSLLLLIGD
jgi:predicted HTH transcriptional regulator